MICKNCGKSIYKNPNGVWIHTLSGDIHCKWELRAQPDEKITN